MCVYVCMCLLHNSKAMNPSSLKLCMHTKDTPWKWKSENWMFGLIKTPLLKIINGLISLYPLSGGPRPPRSTWSLKVYPRLLRWGLKPPCFLSCSSMSRLGTGRNNFLTIKFYFFTFLTHIIKCLWLSIYRYIYIYIYMIDPSYTPLAQVAA